MMLRDRFLSHIFLAGLAITVTTGIALAQSPPDNATPVVPSRADWEQRLLRQPSASSNSTGVQSSNDGTDFSLSGSHRPRGVWVPAHPVSAEAEVVEPGTPIGSSAVTMPTGNSGNTHYEASPGDVQFRGSAVSSGGAGLAPVATRAGNEPASDPAYGPAAMGPSPGPAYTPPDEEPGYGPDGGPGGVNGGDTFCDCDGCPGGCFNGSRRALRNVSVFGGVEGLLTNSLGSGPQGGIGFREGFNWGGPLGGTIAGDDWREIGFQVGMAADEIHIEGNNATAAPGELNQIFVTGGFFHRAVCGGLQWGVVFDFAHDSYSITEDLSQLRFEISFANPCCGEFGFWGTTSLNAASGILRTTDLYTLFYRKYFGNGGNGRVFGGLTEDGGGIVGADVELPLGRSWAWQSGLSVLIPSNEAGNGGVNLQQSWSVGMQLVWYPGRSAECQLNSPFRPLQSVADNMYFIPRFVTH